MYIAISFVFFVLVVTAVGLYASRRSRRAVDAYLTAGRRHGSLVIALSSAAAANSGFIMIGAVGAGYTMGLMAVLMPLSWLLGDLVFWTLFPSKINRIARDSNCNTIPELVSYTTTGKKSSPIRPFLALVSFIFIGLYAIGQFLAAGKAITGAIDISNSAAIMASALVIMVYSAKGGLQSSIPTQFVQAIIMLLTTSGMFLAGAFAVGDITMLIGELEAIDPNLLSIDAGRGALLLIAFVFGFACTAFTFDVGQPHLLIRIMATKSPAEAAKIKWYYMGFIQLTWGMMSLFGLMMVVLLPDIGDPEQAFPTFARQNFHPVVAGAALAGVFAAVASTLDALLLVMSSSVSVDMLPKTNARMTDKYGVRYQVVTTIAVTVIISVLAVLFSGSTNVIDIMLFGVSGVGVTVGCAVLVSILKWNTSSTALIVSASSALIVAASWRALGLSSYVVEAAPGFMTGLFVHYLYARFFLRAEGQTWDAQKSG